MFAKKLFVVVLFAVVASVLMSACSGSIANSSQNCKDWDKNFVDENKDGKADSPVSCEEMSKKASAAIDQTKKDRIQGVCFDIAAKEAKNGKPVVVKTADGKYQYKWVNEFGMGNQDCSNALPYAYWQDLFSASKVILGR